MADQAKLVYATGDVTLQVLRVYGASEPDKLSKFPGIIHEMLDGSLSEQIAGGRREIKIDFQTMSAVERRKVVKWWLDSTRTIYCVMAKPGAPVNSVLASGTGLPVDTYKYRLVVVDVIGQSEASDELTVVVSDADYGIAPITWTAVSDARMYKLYRKKGGDDEKLILYTMATSFTDDYTAEEIAETHPTACSHIHVVTSNDLEFQWGFDTELNRLLTLELREASIFTSDFPV